MTRQSQNNELMLGLFPSDRIPRWHKVGVFQDPLFGNQIPMYGADITKESMAGAQLN